MGDGSEAGGAAIERDDERGAGIDQFVHGGDIGAIAFKDAVGDMHLRLDAEVAQITGHQRTGTGAVDVVITEQGDGFVIRDGPSEAGGEHVHGG